MKEYRFDLSKKKGCSIQSFVIKETNGHDEETAVVQAKARGGAATMLEELVRVSITYVDGLKVDQPLMAYDDWNSRTRGYVLHAFQSVNGADDHTDFRASGVPFPLQKTPEGGAADSGTNG